MDNKVNKEDGKILVCDVCEGYTDHVVCFNNRKENELRVCKDCMEEAMGCFEDDEPKKKPEDECRDCHAKKHRDQQIKGLRDDLKKKMDLIKELKKDRADLENAYNSRVKKSMLLLNANQELTGKVNDLTKDVKDLKEALKDARDNVVFYKAMYDDIECREANLRYECKKLSSWLTTRVTIVCLLSIAVGAAMATLFMR